MKNISLILIALGMMALVYSGIDYSIRENLIDLHSVNEKRKMLNWPPIIGLVLLLTGVIIHGLDDKKASN